MFKTAYNSTDRPVVTDDEGRTLAGREFGPVDTRKDEVKAAVEFGQLILHDDKAFSGSDVSDQAKDAAKQTAALNSQDKKDSTSTSKTSESKE